MIPGLKKYIEKQKFNPDILGLIINPFFIVRRGLWANIKKYSQEISGDVLDIGCGKKPYRSLFNVSKYIGMDIENPGHDHSTEQIDVFYDGTTFPFADGSFDSAISSEVLEHVFNPGRFVLEINRVLKVDGKLLLTVPFMWDEHEQPHDFGRYSSFGVKSLLERNGFEIIAHTKSVNNLGAVVQLFSLYLYKIFYSKNRVMNALLTCMFISPFMFAGIVMAKILPSSSDFFLNNVLLAKKIQSVS